MSEQRLSGKQALQFIQSRTMVDKAGKFNLQVIGNPQLHEGKYIINLKAITPRGLEKAKEHLREGEYDAGANTNMSTNVFVDSDFVPSKGEYVSCMVDRVDTRDGQGDWGIVSISEIATTKAGKASLGDEFANLAEEEAPAKEENLG